MNSSNALSSLVASYTDSENEDGDNNDELFAEPRNRCSKKLQDRVNYLHSQIQNNGLDMNDVIRSRKEFHNPCMYEKLIDFCDLDEFGTNYSPEIFDPKIWGKESYYDELSKVQNAELEKNEKKLKEKAKIEIVSGTAKKTRISNGNASSSILPSTNGAKRKSRWDLRH